MASYHVSIKAVSRDPSGANQKSSVAAAAYRACTSLTNHRDGINHDFSRKSGLVAEFILVPPGAEWALDREALWNAVEQTERRKDSKLAREYEVALPASLGLKDRVVLAKRIGRFLVDRYGVVADIAIHAPSRQGDTRNYHAHILTTTREATPNGFGSKTRILDVAQTSAAEVELIRKTIAALTNEALARADSAERVNHRSFRRQGIELIPTRHLGVAATNLERRGHSAARSDSNTPSSTLAAKNRNIFQDNQITTLEMALRKAQRTLAKLKRERLLDHLRDLIGTGAPPASRKKLILTPPTVSKSFLSAAAPTPRKLILPVFRPILARSPVVMPPSRARRFQTQRFSDVPLMWRAQELFLADNPELNPSESLPLLFDNPNILQPFIRRVRDENSGSGDERGRGLRPHGRGPVSIEDVRTRAPSTPDDRANRSFFSTSPDTPSSAAQTPAVTGSPGWQDGNCISTVNQTRAVEQAAAEAARKQAEDAWLDDRLNQVRNRIDSMAEGKKKRYLKVVMPTAENSDKEPGDPMVRFRREYLHLVRRRDAQDDRTLEGEMALQPLGNSAGHVGAIIFVDALKDALTHANVLFTEHALSVIAASVTDYDTKKLMKVGRLAPARVKDSRLKPKGSEI